MYNDVKVWHFSLIEQVLSCTLGAVQKLHHHQAQRFTSNGTNNLNALPECKQKDVWIYLLPIYVLPTYTVDEVCSDFT